MIILPLIFWIQLFLLFYRRHNMREALLWSMLLWMFCLVVLLEVLSLFRAVNVLTLAGVYSAGIVVLGTGLFLQRQELRWPSRLKGLDRWEQVLMAIVILFSCVTLATALIAPPNNYDAMTYHMSRVAHWAQNQSLSHYPTGILRQLFLPPAAEYVVLLFQVMSGGDRLANLVQWLAMLGSLFAVTLISGRLGLNRKWQLFAAFVAATIPMGIMQATSTQTDYCAGFWVLCFAYFTLSLRKDVSLENMIGSGLAGGLAMLTKPTAYFFIFPFLIWAAISIFKAKRNELWKYLLVFGLAVLVINSGFFARNVALFGSPLWTENKENNEVLSPPNLAVNVIKYFSNHFGAPFPVWNQALTATVVRLSGVLRVNINDPRTSSYGEYIVLPYTPHEDVIGNPIHLVLIFLGAAVFVWQRRRKANSILFEYFILVVVGLCLFFAFIKYQPWLSRLTLPAFLLFSPFIAATIEELASNLGTVVIAVLLVTAAFPPLLMNITKPLIPPPLANRSKYSILNTPREFFYFGGGKIDAYHNYQNVVELIKSKGYREIGVISINNEYPLWALLKNRVNDFKLEHVGVNNLSGKLPASFKEPSVVIVFGKLGLKQSLPGFRYSFKEHFGQDNLGNEIIVYGK